MKLCQETTLSIVLNGKHCKYIDFKGQMQGSRTQFRGFFLVKFSSHFWTTAVDLFADSLTCPEEGECGQNLRFSERRGQAFSCTSPICGVGQIGKLACS